MIGNLEQEEVARSKELEASKKKQSKLEYQVKHLICNLESLETKT